MQGIFFGEFYIVTRNISLPFQDILEPFLRTIWVKIIHYTDR